MIKYRAWITEYEILADVKAIHLENKKLLCKLNEKDFMYDFKDVIISRSTDLMDVNNKEIYIKDKVKITDKEKNEVNEYTVSEVNGNIYVELKGELDDLLNTYLFNHRYSVEVIGNVHEV